jgi:hypothetical protein
MKPSTPTSTAGAAISEQAAGEPVTRQMLDAAKEYLPDYPYPGWADDIQGMYQAMRATAPTTGSAPESVAWRALTDEQLSAIDTAACEWADDWSERQAFQPTKQACNAMFIRRVIALLAASMGGEPK